MVTIKISDRLVLLDYIIKEKLSLLHARGLYILGICGMYVPIVLGKDHLLG